jgi:hypothetical protein
VFNTIYTVSLTFRECAATFGWHVDVHSQFWPLWLLQTGFDVVVGISDPDSLFSVPFDFFISQRLKVVRCYQYDEDLGFGVHILEC